MDRGKNTPRSWKWPIVVVAFFSFVGGSLSFAKGKHKHPEAVLPPDNDNIVTVAGMGLDVGDGGLAIDAQLSNVRNPDFDSVGNLYIVDFTGHRIRKVDKTTGIISTVVGNGVAGSLGDGGPATAAQINGPGGVAFDSAGNLYISEFFGHRVRMVTAHAVGQPIDGTETISTVAGTGSACPLSTNPCGDGGSAIAAQLNQPTGIAIGPSGSLYIADELTHRVRKVTAGTITAVAGTGTPGYNLSEDGGSATLARLSNPSDVAFDSSGNLYITDTQNHRIRKVTAGTISTAAGTGTAGYIYPGCPAGDGCLATAAQINLPRGIAVDSEGNLYIGEFNGQRVRKVDILTGQISTVAGTGTAGYSGDGGSATEAKLNGPWGLGVDAAGNLYIADSNNSCIRKIDILTGKISTIAGSGTAGYGVRCSHNPALPCTTNSQCNALFVGSTCSIGDNLPAELARLNVPRGLAADSLGNIYIADVGNHRIRKISTTGIITTVAGNGVAGFLVDGVAATSTRINRPFDVEIASSGILYIADTSNHRVRKVVPGSDEVLDGLSDPDPEEIITTVAGNGMAGSLGDGGLATEARLDGPGGVAATSSGILYISDSVNSRIRKVDTGGIITTIAGTEVGGFSGDGGLATEAQLNIPRGLSLDPAENLYITDVANSRIRRLNLATPVNVAPGTLNLSSEERWVKAKIQFPAGWDASDVDFDSVMLQAIDSTDGALRFFMNEVLQTAREPGSRVKLKDTNRDRVPDKLILKYDQATVVSWVTGEPEMVLRVEGRFQDGRYFSGDTVIRITMEDDDDDDDDDDDGDHDDDDN